MALSAKIVGFTCPASTGAFAVTGVGFQPKAVLLFTLGTTVAPPSAPAGERFSLGVGVSATDRRSMAVAYGSGVAWWILDHANVLQVPNTVNTVVADLTSLDADGFTLNFSTTASGVYVSALCLGGVGLQVKSGSFARATAVGAQAITGVGFQPTAVIFFQPNVVTATGNARGSIVQQMGFTTGPTQMAATSLRITNNSDPTVAKVGQTTSQCIQTVSATAVTSSAGCTSLDSDGFTLDWTVVSATAALVDYIAIGGVAASVGAFNQPNSNSSQTVSTGSTAAEAVLLLSDNYVSGASINAGCRQSIGVFTQNEQHCFSHYASDNTSIATEKVVSFHSRSQAFKLGAEAAANTLATAGDASVTGVASDSFTLAWTNTDGTQREVLFLALGEQTANIDVPKGALTFVGNAPSLAHRICLPSEP